MSMLARAGIVGENTKTYDVFNRYISPNFLSIPKMSPSIIITSIKPIMCKRKENNPITL